MDGQQDRKEQAYGQTVGQMDRLRNNRTGCKTEQQTRITVTTEREKDIDYEKHVVCQKKREVY